ncbi:phage portal protein [Nonomuraea roseoviolacea]|uniref:phage portal protein n=1 Tax=Nonomuraea roseoviolacea TaxID=103837 RepID=UPI0031D395D8
MSINFYSPSTRAAGSDLAISISPLGLVELADEEFQIHGPRLNRYASSWAFYLGHHHAYRREPGEARMTFNYVRGLTDFGINFALGRGVTFQSAKEYAHIVPALLNRVWETDNNKPEVLHEIGQQGGVSGDMFVKIAYENAWTDSANNFHPGRVRILPINSSFVFPEWHPHDRERLLRVKIKYKFWGTNLEGTRQVFTYTEVLTDSWIEEYINDDLIDQRPNPLGIIPIAYAPNISVSGSPWGLSDSHDLIALNRQYNEVAEEVADIIAYHAAPVTIITGAKASNLEKGAKKVWGGLPKDAQVFNLENGVDLTGPLNFMQLLKTAMHEMAGVPETALGSFVPISNTSGVSLAIMWEPATRKRDRKLVNLTRLLRQVNELVLRTLFMNEPETLYYDPDTDGIIQPGQPAVIDPADPLVYRTECEWPDAMPTDKLIKLNEIQVMMALGLESKRGALKSLGVEFPDEKAQEIFEELVKDAKEQGALDIINAQIGAAIVETTGMNPDGTPPEQPKTSTSPASGSTNSNPPAGPKPKSGGMSGELKSLIDATGNQIKSELVTQAYGTKLPQRRNPDTDN